MNLEAERSARRQLRSSFSGGSQARFMVELPNGHTVKTLRNSLCCLVVLFIIFSFFGILGLNSVLLVAAALHLKPLCEGTVFPVPVHWKQVMRSPPPVREPIHTELQKPNTTNRDLRQTLVYFLHA